MTTRRSLAAALAPAFLFAAGLAAAQPGPGRYQTFGDARGFLNIVPPGSDGVLNGPEAVAAQGGTFPPHFMDQLNKYGDLVYAVPGLTGAQLPDFYQDAPLRVR